MIAAHACRRRVVVHVRERLAPLLRDLSVEVHPYIPLVTDVDDEAIASELDRLTMSPYDEVLDLIGSEPVQGWIRNRPGDSIGYVLDPNDLPYTKTCVWSLPSPSGEDRTHVAVRLLRSLEAHGAARAWPEGAFDRARFVDRSTGSTSTVALAPGSCVRGDEKRMPLRFWQGTAAWLRTRGHRVRWFLGPDEKGLVPLVVEHGDELVDGPWDEALDAHARCRFGVSNETCHMHLRAHLGRETLAFFRREDAATWGSYPKFVRCVEPPLSLDETSAMDAATQWLSGFEVA